MMNINLSLYLIIDDSVCHPDNMVNMAKRVIHCGVTCVQLRMKNATSEIITETGKKLLFLLKPLGIPLIINDHIEIAKNIDADGVHIGQKDIPYFEARNYLGYGKIIGLSIENIKQAQQSQDWDVDYFGVGPVYITTLKPDAARPIGIHQLQQIVQVLKKPVVAIGGLRYQNILPVLNAGVAGVAVISAIISAPDPEFAAKNLAEIIERHRENYDQQQKTPLRINYCRL